ncbi:IPT/TIG domain-containing protein [Streptomyces sp. NBC_00582]|uniref:IPT/TIG domain-containing protein n=1 Tax=Streptomyces sp. NBC_00582 TaxID=2975783 RepID=UPI002E81FBD7|nr:IPT/TIG domain-containing protein [Streptomyces sp. NBC_00582]WUB59415.1 IPT/TIG domain-containing protein [Streptomyces sp. NBC_00582]
MVTFTGTDLAGTTAVMFGTRPAGRFTQVSPTEVTAVSPPGTGTVGVMLTTAGGTSNPAPFHYVGPPFLCSLSAASGPLAGGGVVTLYGTELSAATSVRFGTHTVVPTVVTDRQLTAPVPAGAATGLVTVTVTTAGGTSNTATYAYVGAPTVTTLSPTLGSPSGGTAFTITGTNLTGAQ